MVIIGCLAAFLASALQLTAKYHLLFFSHSVMSNILWPHVLQHTRLPCPSCLPEFAQTHIHWVGDAIQPSYPLLPPSPPALSLSQHQSLFHELALCIRWPNIGASASASVLPMNIQGWFPLGLTGWISLQSKGLSRVFSSTTVWRHQFLDSQPSLWSNSHIHTWLLEELQLWLHGLCQKNYVCFLKILSMFVTAFLPKSMCLLISCL